LTIVEARTVQRLARANRCTVADLIRLTLLEAADDCGRPAPLVLGEELIARIVASQKSRRVLQSVTTSESGDRRE
jgi:hypothetical protein